MGIILNIDTAVQSASVCLAQNGQVLGLKINPLQKDHAAWLHVAIKDLIQEKNISLQQINAIAISSGPGSYTGLRVGMAAAKGLCYALQIPLITINTLQLMTFAALHEPTELFCPMIDARRMEVFTAVFNIDLEAIVSPVNIILNETSFQELLYRHTIIFFGNGSTKFRQLNHDKNAVFKQVEANAAHMVSLSFQKFIKQDFADLAYTEPFYGKDFHSSVKRSL